MNRYFIVFFQGYGNDPHLQILRTALVLPTYPPASLAEKCIAGIYKDLSAIAITGIQELPYHDFMSFTELSEKELEDFIQEQNELIRSLTENRQEDGV